MKKLSLFLAFLAVIVVVSGCLTILKKNDKITTMPPIASGWTHSAFLDEDGSVWTWGRNNHGQLGDGTESNSSLPVQVKNTEADGYISDIEAVTAGRFHTVAIMSGGTVWTWGSNSSGQLGDWTTEDRSTPVQVKGPGGQGHLSGIIAVSAGWSHTVALSENRNVWAWGSNLHGQLGNGTNNNSNVPVLVKDADGEGSLSDVIAIAAGRHHTLALKDDGTVWAWGSNEYGQLGDATNDSTNKPVQVRGPGGQGHLSVAIAISAGCFHSIALREDGNVWTWGLNEYGQLGDDTVEDKNTPIVVKGSGGVEYLGSVVGIAAGGAHCVVLKADGTLWTWGWNEYGQLGNNSTINSSTPVVVRDSEGQLVHEGVVICAAGGYHTIMQDEQMRAWSFGRNRYGQLGNGTQEDSSKPVLVQLPE